MYITIKQVQKLIDEGHSRIKIKRAEHIQTVNLKKVQVGKGERTFFICPCCGKSAYKLYLDNTENFKCVHCTSVNPYEGIQNTTKGGYVYLQYKMERFAMNCGIGSFEYPFDYKKHPKPKGKHIDKWNKNLAIMQALENMRFQSILYQKAWNPKTVKSIVNGKNIFLSLSLEKLKRYFYPFDTGILRY